MSAKDKNEYWFAKVDVAVIRDKSLSQNAKWIFTVLCTFADKDTRGCWPSNKAVAEAADVSERTVRRAYKELEARGLITRESRFNTSGQTSSYSLIVGHNAPCYGEDTDDHEGRTPASYGTRIKEQDIKDSLTGEAELPISEEFPEMPDEYSPEDAPDIMKPTAEYLLLKTGRESLTWEEISALRELTVNQYPSRVQKEINRAYERFRRKGHDLKKLTFVYIAGSLKHQPTRNRPQKIKPDPMSLTSAEVDEANVKNGMSDSEMQYWLEKCERECV